MSQETHLVLIKSLAQAKYFIQKAPSFLNSKEVYFWLAHDLQLTDLKVPKTLKLSAQIQKTHLQFKTPLKHVLYKLEGEILKKIQLKNMKSVLQKSIKIIYAADFHADDLLQFEQLLTNINPALLKKTVTLPNSEWLMSTREINPLRQAKPWTKSTSKMTQWAQLQQTFHFNFKLALKKHLKSYSGLTESQKDHLNFANLMILSAFEEHSQMKEAELYTLMQDWAPGDIELVHPGYRLHELNKLKSLKLIKALPKTAYQITPKGMDLLVSVPEKCIEKNLPQLLSKVTKMSSLQKLFKFIS